MQYRFSDCVLDTELRELRRAGRAVSVRPQVLQVLIYLIEHRERVVPKQELFDKLWQGRVVGDATLNSCLKDARRAVGDNGRDQRLLKTLHGHGYHFVAALEDPGETAAESRASAPPVEREYKQVSVLAGDLQNATELETDGDPERLDELHEALYADVRAVLERYGGVEIEWRGNGFTALFGAPRSFEDHARRAALAALDLRRAARTHAADRRPTWRIGLHCGRVVAGPHHGAASGLSASGEAIRVAQRIAAAADDAVLASEALFGLVEAEVNGTLLAGGDAREPLVRIEALMTHRGGVPRRTTRKRSRFVGREEETRIVARRLARAAEGDGQVVCISGEPGIGKSRLLDECVTVVEDARVLTAGCLAYRAASPYFPLLGLLAALCGEDGQPSEAALGSAAAAAGLADADGAALIAVAGRADESGALPAARRERVFDAANRLLLRAAAERPLVLAIEDLHWIDATSQEWLDGFVARAGAVPVLLLLTYRPGYRPPWLAHSWVTQLALPRLTDTDSAALVESLPGVSGRAAVAKREIVNNAQGNPFFLEELAYDLAARETGEDVRVPTTVEAVLASRIDQLSATDKSLLQMAAAIGTPVDYALLAACSDSADIDADIARLAEAEFLYADFPAEPRRLRFRHALTRDVAYRSMLSGARRERHRRIAEVCERHFPERVQAEPELAAYHFGEAGEHGKALHHWRAAGRLAARRSANPEAVTHFEHALKAAERLPSSRELKETQLDIYLSLGPPLMSSRSFTSPDVEAAYRRARRLCEEVGTRRDLLTVLWGLWLHYAHRGRIDDARSLADRIYAMASELVDDGLMLQAHHAVWTTEIWHGDLERCNEHARAGMALYDRERHASHKYLYGGHDPGVCAHGTAAICAWFLGRPDESIRLTRQGAELAGTLDHPYSRIITLFDFMEVEALRGHPRESGHYAAIAKETCAEQRVPNYLAVARVFSGYSRAQTGERDAGIAELKDGLRSYRDLGAQRLLAPYLLLLAELLATPDDAAEGLAAVDEAEALIERTGEVRWAAEIHRMRGELLLAGGSDAADRAAALFAEALEIAARQACLAFELRAATSLARLWLGQGRRAEAAETLLPVLERFAEGFDTRDVERATALAAELAA